MDTKNDLKILYAAWPAEEVIWLPKTGSGKTKRAIFNQAGTEIVNNTVISVDCSLRYPADSFPDVRKGDRFIIDRRTWIAREKAQPTEDGEEHIVPLARPA